MIAYEGQYAPLLVKWWAEIRETPEFAKTVHSSAQSLDAFICYFRHTASLMFEADSQGIWFAASTTPFYDGATFDLWIRPAKRHRPAALKATEMAYELALERYPNLFGFTAQRELHTVHLKLGYTYGGILRKNMDGSDQYIYQLTREGWANRKHAAMIVRETKREKRMFAAYSKANEIESKLNGATA